MPTNELLVTGKFSDEEFAKLAVKLKPYRIKVYRRTECHGVAFHSTDAMPHVSPPFVFAYEVIKICFYGFNGARFITNLLLSKILVLLFNKTIKWVKNKRPRAKIQTEFELNLGSKPTITATVTFNSEDVKNDFKEIMVSEFIGSLKDKSVSIVWDKANDEINISRT